MPIHIHKIPTQELARSLDKFVKHFMEHGSMSTLSVIDEPVQIHLQILYLLERLDEIDWQSLGVKDVQRYVSGLRTVASDIEYTLNRPEDPEPTIRVILEKARKTSEGYVYLVKAVAPEGVYKIGLSKEPVTRFSRFEVILPFDIEVLHLIKTKDMRGLENKLHTKYAEKRIRGEWFALTDADVQEICAMKDIE